MLTELMNNDDLLKKIEKLFEVEREHTSKLIDTKLDEKLEPIKSDVAGIQTELQEHGKQFKAVNRKLNRVQKDIKLVLKYHDEMHIRLRERIEALEKQPTHN